MQIVNADVYKYMKSMPDKSVDLIYTDPPYDVPKFKSGSGGSVNNVMNFDKTLEEVNKVLENGYDMDNFLKEAMRIMKEPNIYIWCNKRQIVPYMNFFVNENNCLFDILVWKKTNALPTYSNKYLTDCEYCLYFHKGKGKCFPKSYTDASTVYLSPINRENKIYGHPNIKPLPFVKSMISNSANKDSVVFDGFLGSGTTGVACKELGIDNFIGVEIREDYYTIAKTRIENINNAQDLHKVELF